MSCAVVPMLGVAFGRQIYSLTRGTFLLGMVGLAQFLPLGVTASWFGIVPAMVLGGIGSIAVAMQWMRFFPA